MRAISPFYTVFPENLYCRHVKISLTLSQTSSGFYVSAVQVFWKHCGTKEKLLIMSNFSFSHSVFYLFRELFAVSIKFKIVNCKLWVLKSLKFVVLERVKGLFGKGLKQYSYHKWWCLLLHVCCIRQYKNSLVWHPWFSKEIPINFSCSCKGSQLECYGYKCQHYSIMASEVHQISIY